MVGGCMFVGPAPQSPCHHGYRVSPVCPVTTVGPCSSSPHRGFRIGGRQDPLGLGTGHGRGMSGECVCRLSVESDSDPQLGGRPREMPLHRVLCEKRSELVATVCFVAPFRRPCTMGTGCPRYVEIGRCRLAPTSASSTGQAPALFRGEPRPSPGRPQGTPLQGRRRRQVGYLNLGTASDAAFLMGEVFSA